MILWAVLMVVLFVAMIAGMVYLITRIRKSTFMKKLAGGSEKKATLLSTAVITGAVAFFWLLWGFINAVIILLHLIVFWLVSEGIFALVRKKRGGEFQRYYAGVVAVLFTIGYLGAGWYQAHHVWEKTYTITTDKKVGNFRAALISDSHTGTTFHGKGFAEHLKEIEKQNPDVLLVAGDFVDDDTTKEDMIRCCEALGQVKTTYGVYYVFGNHDKGYYSPDYRGYSGDDLVAELEANGVHVLQDENELILVGAMIDSAKVEICDGYATLHLFRAF